MYLAGPTGRCFADVLGRFALQVCLQSFNQLRIIQTKNRGTEFWQRKWLHRKCWKYINRHILSLTLTLAPKDRTSAPTNGNATATENATAAENELVFTGESSRALSEADCRKPTAGSRSSPSHSTQPTAAHVASACIAPSIDDEFTG